MSSPNILGGYDHERMKQAAKDPGGRPLFFTLPLKDRTMSELEGMSKEAFHRNDGPAMEAIADEIDRRRRSGPPIQPESNEQTGPGPIERAYTQPQSGTWRRDREKAEEIPLDRRSDGELRSMALNYAARGDGEALRAVYEEERLRAEMREKSKYRDEYAARLAKATMRVQAESEVHAMNGGRGPLPANEPHPDPHNVIMDRLVPPAKPRQRPAWEEGELGSLTFPTAEGLDVLSRARDRVDPAGYPTSAPSMLEVVTTRLEGISDTFVALETTFMGTRQDVDPLKLPAAKPSYVERLYDVQERLNRVATRLEAVIDSMSRVL